MASFTIEVETPDGTMFVTICDDEDGKPVRLEIIIGKAGAPLLAWAYALSRMCTIALRQGVPLITLMSELTGISSHRQVTKYLKRVSITSGPDGVAKAMLTYFLSK